jgi:glycosyltransferase involved in cell wall biosynthesis
MRLALVSQEYPPETAYGGIGTQNYAKAHGLTALGHDVHVISHSTDDRQHAYADGDVQVIRIPGFDNRLPIATEEARWITYSAQVAAAVADLHARKPLDLVEFADWGSEAFVHLLNQTEWNRIPTVIHLHGPIVMFAHAIGWPDPHSKFYEVASMMEKLCLRRADAVFSSSRCSAEWCERFHGMDARQIPVMHTGIDTKVFHPLDVPKAENPTIIFIGKIEPNKGVELLVDAACQLAKRIPNLRLRLLGRGNPELAKKLAKRVNQTGCPEVLELVGYVDHAQLANHISRAHVFAAPSEYEGGPGFVYLEAMACGLPVVGCLGSGASEVIRHGETGLLIAPRDLDALVSSLESLLTDTQLRQQFGSKAANYVNRECSRESCLCLLEEFYLEVVSRQKHTEPAK